MSDGIERAAQRILKRHLRPTNMPDDPWCNHCDRPWPCVDHEDARVILDANAKAIQHLEGIRELHAGSKGVTWEFAVAALACLQGDDA